MTRYLVARAATMLPTLFVASVVVFLILRLVPGDPAQIILGATADPVAIQGVREDLGLEKPLLTQYGEWIGGVLTGDLGVDYRSHEPLTASIGRALPVTIELIILAQLMSVLIAIPLGVMAAVHPRRWQGKLATVIGLFGISVPDFWLGIMLILLFALQFGFLPSDGFIPIVDGLGANLQHMILPSLTIAIALAAVLVRITRASVLEVLSQEYVTLATLKGLPRRAVLFKHVLRNALIPVLTVIGMQSGYYLGAAVAVETVFALPGLGRLALESVLNRNYPVIQASVLTIVALFMLITLIVDVVVKKITPE